MATRLSPLGQVVKWLVVPALLAAAGYYLVGPRVTDKLPAQLKDRVEAATGNMTGLSTSTSPEQSSNTPSNIEPSTFAAPQVDVTVSQLGNPEKPKKKKRRRRKKPPTEQSTPSAPAPAQDGGTGGGTSAPPPDGENG